MDLQRTAVLALASLALLATVPLQEAQVVQPAQASHAVRQIGAVCQGYPATTNVDIEDAAFNPDTVYIAWGDIVHWVNVGVLDHTTTSDIVGLWDSGVMDPGDHFDVRFCIRGLFEYHCAIHGFEGRVFVS